MILKRNHDPTFGVDHRSRPFGYRLRASSPCLSTEGSLAILRTYSFYTAVSMAREQEWARTHAIAS
jgi:hypothetical protein